MESRTPFIATPASLPGTPTADDIPPEEMGRLKSRQHPDRPADWRFRSFKDSVSTSIEELHMPDVKLDHCVIHVSDWERSNAFYRDVVGAQLIRRGAGWAYRFGDAQLNCHGPGAIGNPLARLPVTPGNSDLCFVWPGPIDEAAAHLQRHGVAVELGPVPREGARDAGTSVYFRDPDGSLLEFISYTTVR
jgi:catechol 2,3-dioxygenase-like lactoylglutathione lyase family enzyme